MKKRNIFLVPLLTVITFGLYGIYWLYDVRRDLVKITRNKKDIPPVYVLFSPIIVFLSLLLILSFLTASSYDQFNNSLLVFNILAILFVIAMFLVPFWWFYRFFMTLSQVTRQTDGVVLYVIGFVLVIVGVGVFIMLIAQNDINKFITQNHNKYKLPT